MQRQSGSSVRGRIESRAPASPLWRYLPLALLVTTSLVLLPAVLAAAIVPRAGTLAALASVACAVAASLAIACGEAALWKRCPGSRDLVFGDLLLWGWARRCWAERRLARARSLYDAASRAGPAVSIELLTTLSALLGARDAYTHGHSQRVARHAERIARAMRLGPVQTAKIRTAAAVHDVGKLYTPRAILNNPRRLSEAEFEVMKRHATDGADMLAAVGDPEIAAMVRHHHERIDGSGYPDRLAGSGDPLGSRIIAVADTFDSITSNRPYRRADKQKRALDVLTRRPATSWTAPPWARFATATRRAARSPGLRSRRPRCSAWARACRRALQASAPSRVAPRRCCRPSARPVCSPSPRRSVVTRRRATAHPRLPRRDPASCPAAAAGPAVGRAPRAVGRRGGARSGSGAGRGTARSMQGPSSARTPGSSTTPASAGPPATSPAAPVRGPSPPGQANPPTSLPPQSAPSLPPAPVQPPAGGAPAVPALPVSPPATLPSVPVPSVGTPSVGASGVSVPGVTVPSVGTSGR